MKLHLTHDDKFIDAFIEQAQTVDQGNHHFYIYSQTTVNPLNFVKSKDIKRISINELNRGALKIEDYETVYIHYFSNELIDFVINNGDKTTFVWIFWGADAFDLPLFNKSFLAPETATISKKLYAQFSNTLKKSFSTVINSFNSYKLFKKKAFAASKFNYFAHYIPQDYQLIKSKLKLKAEYIEFTYGSLKSFATNKLMPSSAQNILVGNSANPANNHIDVLKQLSSVENLSNSQVFCPLSYSGTDEYKSIISNIGLKLFKENFKPLIDFMPRPEYDKIINGIGYAFMPHYRSQAFGNIISLLWQGTRVFFYQRNSLYHYLKNNGMIVSEITDDIELTPLSEEEKQHNRKILEVFLGIEAVRNNYKKILSI